MLDQSHSVEPEVLNGLDVTEYGNIVEAVREQPHLARFEFRARNVWEDGAGGYTRTTIGGFFAAGAEQGTDGRSHVIEIDEPPVLLGIDRAPNPAEYLLNALAGCLTSTVVYKAASRGILLESVEASVEGDMDARNFLELSSEQRTGYQGLRARIRVKTDASVDEIRELVQFSPVLDTLTHGTAVTVSVEET